MTKNYLLTDFNDDRWKGIDIESVKLRLNELITNKEKRGVLYGEYRKLPNDYNIGLFFKNVSHTIDNITFVDNKIYADIKFLKTEYGIKLKNYIYDNNLDVKFNIRAISKEENDSITISQIFTWDICDIRVNLDNKIHIDKYTIRYFINCFKNIFMINKSK